MSIINKIAKNKDVKFAFIFITSAILMIIFAIGLLFLLEVYLAGWDIELAWEGKEGYYQYEDVLPENIKLNKIANQSKISLQNHLFMNVVGDQFGGELPDSFIVTSYSKGRKNAVTTRSCTAQKIKTVEVKTERITKKSVYAALIFTIILFVFVVVIFFVLQERLGDILYVIYEFGIVVLVLMVCAFFFLIMVNGTLYIDNATPNTSHVYIDNELRIRLEPYTHAKFIIGGGLWDLRVESGPVENRQTIKSKLRLFERSGISIVYNIEKANSYTISTKRYRSVD